MEDNDPQVLVVDDEPIIREQVTRALNAVGLECESAIDGDDALRRFDERFYPLVVTDLRMPHRHGHSLFLELSERTDRPKIVALTGVTETWLAKDLVTRGIDEIFYKPVNYFELANRLKEILKPSPAACQELENLKDATQSFAPEPSLPSVVRTTQTTPERWAPDPWIFTALYWLDWRRVPNPPQDLRRYISSLEKGESRSQRIEQSKNASGRIAVAMSLDENLQPLGNPYKFIVRQITAQQIRLVYPAKPQGAYLSIVLLNRNKQRIVMLLKALDSQPLENGIELTCEILRQ